MTPPSSPAPRAPLYKHRMKWREGDTGRWDFLPRWTGRKKGVRAAVERSKHGGHSFFLERGDDCYNSLWHAPYFATADEAMYEAERAIDEGYPQPRAPRRAPLEGE